MKNSKIYYGATFLCKKDLVEADINHQIELEYYGTTKRKRKQESYGIEVIKREYKNQKTKMEKNNINNITDNLSKVIEIIETLKKNKVTPIGLQDVVEDLLKQQKELA